MPTASPIISASTGVLALRSTTPDSAVMPAMPMPTPTSAVSRGSPAAISEPNVTTSTMAAMTTPMPSVGWVTGTPCMASPPNSTVQPAARVDSAAACSASRSASVTSGEGTR